jgi:hypothetical protein
MLVTGHFVNPNTNAALKQLSLDDKISPSGAVGVTENLYDKTVLVSLTKQSLETFTRAYFEYHSTRPKEPVLRIVNPRIYVFGSTSDFEEDSSINSQDEEMAQFYSFEYGKVEIGLDGVEITFPDDNYEE